MWTYKQSTGQLTDQSGVVIGNGYSGANPVGYNNPEMQNDPDVGPIPQGFYIISEPINTVAHGPYAMLLIPNSANEMFGRSGFLLHGDSIENPGHASEGCIIMSRQVREAVWNSNDHQLQVVA